VFNKILKGEANKWLGNGTEGMRQFLLNDQARDDALLFGECSEYSREQCDKANGFCKLPTKEFQNCIESMCTTLVACRRTIQKQLRWLIPRKREADSSEEVAKSLNRASPLCRGKHAASCMLKQVLDQLLNPHLAFQKLELPQPSELQL